jgi:hypothetical protein
VVKVEGKNLEFTLNLTFPEENYIRISLKNSIGQSDLSKPIKIKVRNFDYSHSMSINNIMLIMVAVTVPLALLLSSFLVLKQVFFHLKLTL